MRPNTDLILLQNVPLTADYIHTLSFVSRSAQATWFKKHVKQPSSKYTFNDLYRINKENADIIELEISPNDVEDCNYLMFRNTSYGDKWFYAFIKDVIYRNDHNTYIQFEIDEFQTWYFDFYFAESFIERIHTKQDKPGQHRVKENIDFGEYTFKEWTNTKSQTNRLNMSVLVIASFSKDFNDSQGQAISYNPDSYLGMYSGLSMITMTEMGNVTDTDEDYNPNNPKIIPFFKKVAKENKQDGIVAVYMIPSMFAKDTSTYLPIQDRGAIIYENTFDVPDKVDNYTPRNNKLLTAPYNRLMVADGLGGTVAYNFEDFKNGKPAFKIIGLGSGKPEITIVPLDYKNVPLNFNEAFTINNIPMVAYSTDAYRAWLAQNSTSMGLSVGSGIVGAGLSLAGLSNPATMPLAVAGITASLASSVGGVMAQNYQASLQPNRVGGTQGTGASLVYSGEFGLRFYYVSLRKEHAEIMDNYFDMFGYKVSTKGVPDRLSRKYYTYIKTKGCTLSGSIPSKSAERIRQVMDNGITFWNIVECEKEGADVGYYSRLDNRPDVAYRTGWVN
jgi:hypothetical protein